MNQPQKLALLSSLYFSQGLPYGFFVYALPTLLRENDVSLAAIGMANLLALPWALKFLWAPVLDRYGSRRRGWRRGWILPLQILAATSLVLLGWVGIEGGLTVLAGLILLTNLVAATQDIATDGLAVGLLTFEERGLGNSIQVAAYRAGMILGGGVLLLVIGRLGWTSSFLWLAGLLLLASIPIFLFQEPPRPAADLGGASLAAALGQLLGDLFLALKRPGMLLWLLLLIVYKGGDAIASGMINPFLVDVGVTKEEIGWMATVGSGASILGAFAGGLAITRLGRRRGLLWLGILQAVPLLGFLLAAQGWTSLPYLFALNAAEQLTGTMATVAVFTLMMDVCRPDHAGTDYTLQASLVVVAQIGARTASGGLATVLGHGGNFATSAGLSLFGALAVAAALAAPGFRRRLLAPTGSAW